jgi:hypothetical protein
MASWEADEEDRARGKEPDHKSIDELLGEWDTDPPLDEVLLRQVAELAPSSRRSLLTLMYGAPWWYKHEQPPEWVIRVRHYAEFEGAADHHLQRNEDSHR